MRTVALLLGGAHRVWDDVRLLEEINGGPWEGPVIAVNDIGCFWPGRLDHWVTLHRKADKIGVWLRTREERGMPDGRPTVWSHVSSPWVDHAHGGHPLRRRCRTSGLFALFVARDAIGYDGVVGAGVPMTKDPHFAESIVHDDSPWMSANGYWGTFLRVSEQEGFDEFFRAMSGRTGEHFGEPTKAWLGT